MTYSRVRYVGLAMALLALLSVGCSSIPIHGATQGKWYTNPNASAHQFRRVGILGFEDDPLFQQNLTIAFLNRGIDVVEREKVVDLVREQVLVEGKFTDLSDKDKAMALGRLLNVDALVMGGVIQSEYWAMTKNQLEASIKFGLQPSEQAKSQNPLAKSIVNAGFGATYRIVDAASGEIICVGNRILSLQQKAKRENLSKLSQLDLIRLLCNEIVSDSLAAESGTRDAAVTF